MTTELDPWHNINRIKNWSFSYKHLQDNADKNVVLSSFFSCFLKTFIRPCSQQMKTSYFRASFLYFFLGNMCWSTMKVTLLKYERFLDCKVYMNYRFNWQNIHRLTGILGKTSNSFKLKKVIKLNLGIVRNFIFTFFCEM